MHTFSHLFWDFAHHPCFPFIVTVYTHSSRCRTEGPHAFVFNKIFWYAVRVVDIYVLQIPLGTLKTLQHYDTEHDGSDYCTVVIVTCVFINLRAMFILIWEMPALFKYVINKKVGLNSFLCLLVQETYHILEHSTNYDYFKKFQMSDIYAILDT